MAEVLKAEQREGGGGLSRSDVIYRCCARVRKETKHTIGERLYFNYHWHHLTRHHSLAYQPAPGSCLTIVGYCAFLLQVSSHPFQSKLVISTLGEGFEELRF